MNAVPIENIGNELQDNDARLIHRSSDEVNSGPGGIKRSVTDKLEMLSDGRMSENIEDIGDRAMRGSIGSQNNSLSYSGGSQASLGAAARAS